ncbi:MAG: CapA family protein [Ruminococcus sp.]|nr:CapA family protein [Ruminococcus sp.]
MKLRKGRAFTAAALLVGICVGCTKLVGSIDYSNVGSTPVVATPAETAAPTTAPPPEDKRIHIVAAGDNLVQTAVYRNAQQHSADGTSYNFLPLYENVRSIIEAGDISILNQETLIANGEYEISGSNFNFNSPTELGDDMIDLGFNVFTMANNHVLDKGTDGLEATLDYWDARCDLNDIVVCGAYRNEADMQNIRTMTVEGVTFAFLAYTEHMNGYKIPADSPLRVVQTSETAVMESQIKQAELISDVVIVAAHWGVEDTHTVSEDRRILAQNMVEWGADVIIGTHPHTAETMEYLTRSDGTRGFVFYSLGNFISAQTDNFNLVGEIADFDVVVDGVTNEVTLENVGVIPVINHYDDGSFSNMRLYPYNMYTAELADSHGVPYAPAGTAKSFGMDVIDSIIEANIPAEFRKLD